MMNVLVVGAGKGIGFESVQALLNSGHRVMAVSRDVSKLETLSADELTVFQSDISDDSSRDRLIAAVAASGYSFNAVVVTAGQLIKKPYEQLTKEDFSSLYITNVYAVFDLVRRLKSFLAKDFAHIVTIGSMGGVTGSLKFPGMVFYSSSKAALATVTECMAVEWEGEGIHINCLALGAVETDMKNAAFPEFRAPHSAREMGEWVSWFALEAGKFFNGKVLPVSISTP
jgi:3-oxoacyl-[acyl-carrier protein] reductase